MYKTYSKTFTVSLNNIFMLYLHQVQKSRKVHKIELKKKHVQHKVRLQSQAMSNIFTKPLGYVGLRIWI